MPPSQTLQTQHTYERYRMGSTTVVQWLWINAERCSQRSKGMTKSALKRAKEKAKKAPAKTTVAIDEYPALAKTIADSTDPHILVPAWFLHNLGDMILIRKILEHQFTYSATKTEASSDDAQETSDGLATGRTCSSDNTQDTSNGASTGTSSPTCNTPSTSEGSQQEPSMSNLRILEEVFELLKNKHEEDGIPAPSGRLFSTRPFVYLSNDSYQLLFSEEPVKEGEHWQKEPAQPKCSLLPLKDEEDRMLMVQCLFEDFRLIREFIRKPWMAYRRGRGDSYVAAAATNTAIAILQGIIKDLEYAFLPEVFQYEKFLPLAAKCMNSSADIFSPLFVQGHEQQIEMEVWAAADRIGLPAYAILKNYYQNSKQNYRSSLLSHQEPLPPAGDTPAEKFSHAKHILNHFLGEVAFLKSHHNTGRIQMLDHLTRGLAGLHHHTEIDTWIPFACTIHLDIYEALGDNVDVSKSDLLRTCERLHKTFDDFWRLPDTVTLAPEYVPPPKKYVQAVEEEPKTRLYNRSADVVGKESQSINIDDHVQLILDLHNAVINVECDALAGPRIGTLHMYGLWDQEYQPHHLFKINPLLSGVTEFQFMLRMQSVSTEAANEWGSIVSLAWLYRALGRELTHSQPAWLDMEIILGMHSDDFFPEPKNVAEILDRFEKVTGFEGAAEFWKPVPQGVQPSTLLQPQSACYRLLYDSYCQDKPLSQQTFHEEWEWTQSLFLTPELILVELLKCLEVEFCGLKFNYLSMHMRCMRLLSEMHHQLDDRLSERFGIGYIRRPAQLPLLTSFILTDFTMHDTIRKLRNERQREYLLENSHQQSGENEYEGPNGNNEVQDYGNFTILDWVRKLRNDRQREHLLELSHQQSGENEYEAPSGNNEVQDYESVCSDEDPFEDFSSRHPGASNIVPMLFAEAGRIVKEVLVRQSDYEHQDLIRVRIPDEEYENARARRLTNAEQAGKLTRLWIEGQRAALEREAASNKVDE